MFDPLAALNTGLDLVARDAFLSMGSLLTVEAIGDDDLASSPRDLFECGCVAALEAYYLVCGQSDAPYDFDWKTNHEPLVWLAISYLITLLCSEGSLPGEPGTRNDWSRLLRRPDAAGMWGVGLQCSDQTGTNAFRKEGALKEPCIPLSRREFRMLTARLEQIGIGRY